MSSKVVAEIINRAVHDLAFREQISTASAKALADYDLTNQELVNLENMDKSAFATWADNLEEQEQQEGIALGLVILGGNRPEMLVNLIPRTTVSRDLYLERAIFAQSDKLAELLQSETKTRLTASAQTLLLRLAEDFDDADPYTLAQQQVQSQFEKLSSDEVDVFSFYILSEVARLFSSTYELDGKRDSLSELSEEESRRAQMYMDKNSEFMRTLNNLLEKTSQTASEIIQNMK